jgi:RNA polymerase sigma factor (sigma-70 family)
MADPQIRAQLKELHLSAYGWALHCCGRDRGAAEDVLQSVYLKVLEGRAEFDGRSSLKTWIFAVIRNTAAEERRRRWLWSLRFRFLGDSEDHASEESADGSVRESEHRAIFRRTLARLPRRQQEVLHLVFYQDFTIEEAALAMGISPGSARTHYERGKKRFRVELESMEEYNELRNA